MLRNQLPSSKNPKSWAQIYASLSKPLQLICWACIIGVLVLLLSACSSEPDLEEPPLILYGEDVCDRCSMIINEARFATAYTTSTGETRRFDDIGGMLRYDRDMVEDVAAYWVHDFETEEWLKSDEAYYVIDANLQTPMGFGIIAFAARDRAESWAENEGGSVIDFSELLERDIDAIPG